MDSKKLAELLEYSSPNSILVVSYNRKLLELKCPFRIYVRYNIGVLRKGSKENVDIVKITNAMITVFVIKDEAYYYYHFSILID